MFMDLIEQVEKQIFVVDLLVFFNDQSIFDYFVVYLWLFILGYLQCESKFFEYFIEGGWIVKEFCQQEVEFMCKESDYIYIIVLVQVFSVFIQVEYMDCGEGGIINLYIFFEGFEFKVYFFYWFGYYDIFYKQGWFQFVVVLLFFFVRCQICIEVFLWL